LLTNLFMNRNDEAEKLWEENLRVKEELFGPNHPSLIVHLQNLATAYAVAEKHEKCVPLLRRSLKLAVEDLGPDAPQVSVPLECLATALHHLDRQQEAEPIARRALEIREAHYDPDSTIVGKLPLFKCPCIDCRALLVPYNVIPSLNLHWINRPKCLVLSFSVGLGVFNALGRLFCKWISFSLQQTISDISCKIRLPSTNMTICFCNA
jgi:tetratricopeptide (TPR) repeat protein